ncbi:MAG TPA: tetratricopeptide repeat protein [Gemmatimonadales bacterium]|nr:tetratricopeptide repeat protein [Gemmatimonadales bacterium]
MRRAAFLLPAALVAVGGCALRSDVDRVEARIAALQEETARQDSARARQVTELLALQRQLLDTVAASQRALTAFRGDMSRDLYGVQQQLMQVQELTGQSQRRLAELRGDLEARGQQLAAPAGAPAAGAAGPSAAQMYEASLQQLRSGGTATARMGFRQLLDQYPSAPEAADAVYFIGESFAGEAPDSAAAYYRRVVQEHPRSTRAPAALYKLGLLAEQRRDTAAARQAYQQVVDRYPSADEAALARDRLRALGR